MQKMGQFWLNVYVTHIRGSGTVILVVRVNKQFFSLLTTVTALGSVSAKWSYGRLKERKERLPK